MSNYTAANETTYASYGEFEHVWMPETDEAWDEYYSDMDEAIEAQDEAMWAEDYYVDFDPEPPF